MSAISEDQLLEAFEKTLSEYDDGMPWEIVFQQEFRSWDMFISESNRVMDTRDIDHREFVQKMLGHLS